MTLWQKLTTGTKFLFGGFDAAVDYLLNKVLNPYLTTDAVAGNVRKAYETANAVLGYLRKYASWCPSAWEKYYNAIVEAVDVMVGVFADGKVETEEITACINAFKTARAAWNED
ncbi:MAG: hypothetical protein ACI4Q3_00675 [Kiritimatiellia bacterium]